MLPPRVMLTPLATTGVYLCSYTIFFNKIHPKTLETTAQIPINSTWEKIQNSPAESSSGVRLSEMGINPKNPIISPNHCFLVKTSFNTKLIKKARQPTGN